jgi:hypothetical protein
MVERCFELDAAERLGGEKAATVGGFGSYEGAEGPSSEVYVDVGDMEASQGVS